MERLQAAIEKARAQREITQQQPAQAAQARQPAAAPRPTPAPAPSSVDAVWAELEPIKVNERRLPRQRVMTLTGGADAAAFDLLRTRLLQQAKQNGWHRVGFVSPHSACGKTTTVANLAFSLSRQSDTRTIVLDFDLRRRGLSDLLNQKPSISLADVLEGTADFAEHGLRYGENVAFGLNAKGTQKASEILQSGKTQDVLNELKDRYQPDLMLFDLPPLMASDDNFGFLHTVDAALILAAAEKTTMSQIDVAERQVAELTNVMGVVLNRCRYMDGAYGHEYSYY